MKMRTALDVVIVCFGWQSAEHPLAQFLREDAAGPSEADDDDVNFLQAGRQTGPFQQRSLLIATRLRHQTTGLDNGAAGQIVGTAYPTLQEKSRIVFGSTSNFLFR